VSAWDFIDEMKLEFGDRKDKIEEFADNQQISEIEEAFDGLDELIGMIHVYLMTETNPHVRKELMKLQKKMSVYQLQVSKQTGAKLKLAF
jgi:cob(I)alamin adenosyltransferase